MWQRPRASRIAAGMVCLTAAWARAQAPASPEVPWSIPPEAGPRAASDETPAVLRKPYDLAALIDLAQRNNPATRVSWEAARAAAASIGLVESTYLPQLSLQALGGYEHTPLPAPKDLVPAGYFVSNTQEFIPALAMKWLLFDFGQRDAKLEAARAQSFVANVAFTGTHQKIVLTVSQAYFNLGAARGRLNAARQALRTAGISQDATDAKRANGLATVVAVAQAQRQTAQARFDVTRAEGAETTARANLIAALGIAADTELEVVDSSEMPLPPAPEQNVAASIHEALTHRPDVIAALGEIDAAQAALEAERRSYFPVVELGAHAFQNMGRVSSDGKPYSTVDKPGGNVLLSLSVPIFDGGERSSRVSAARAKVRAAEAKLATARDEAANQVVKAYDTLVTSLAEYDAATAVGTAAHTAYDAALRSYRQGIGTYTDLATEENAVAQAEMQIEDAKAAAHSAAAGLAFAMGSMQR